MSPVYPRPGDIRRSNAIVGFGAKDHRLMGVSAGGDGQPITREFCGAIVEVARAGIPHTIREHALSHIGNALGLAVSASRHPGVEAIVRLYRDVGGRPTTRLPARVDMLDSHHAATAIAYAVHVDDFDDTHLTTVIHPTAATLGAIYPLAVELKTPGEEFITAFALGCEAQLRVGAAMSPEHYDAGWHITGTCGVIGAAVAAGLLLELDGDALTQAVGIAASCTLGQREGFGTMLKAIHPGKAAANGLLAARLAAAGFTASGRVLEAPRGFFSVLSDGSRPAAVLTELGRHWEFADDTIKPYPCGIVIHPLIDAGLELHQRIVDFESIASVAIYCHPLVLELTGVKEPADGLAARFSAVHATAAAVVEGAVGLHSFDERVHDRRVISLRQRIDLIPDPGMAKDEVRARATLLNEESVDVYVQHARGSLRRPLEPAELEAKIRGLVNPTLPHGADRLLTAVANLPSAANLEDLVLATSPQED